MERDSMFLCRKNQYCENNYTTKHNLRFNAIPIELPMAFFFYRTRTKSFIIHMETQKTRNSQSNLEKEEWSWTNQPSWPPVILQNYSHQDSMVLAQKQKYRLMDQDRSPEINPCTYGYLIFDKGDKNIHGARTATSISGTGKTGQLHVKEWN